MKRSGNATANAPQLTLTTPYAALTPDTVLDALQAVGLMGDGRLMQLNSFENRVFQVMLDDGDAAIAKFYRPGRWSDAQIAEEHALSIEAAAEDIPVVAPLRLATPAAGSAASLSSAAEQTLGIWTDASDSWRFAVWPRRAGRTPELEDAHVLRRLGSCLARLHNVGSRKPFSDRHTLQVVADAQAALELIRDLHLVPDDQVDRFFSVGQTVLSFIADRTSAWTPQSVRLHGDCHPGNLLWRDDQPNLVDLDDACNGPAVQDLWMLLSGDPDEAQRQMTCLLEGYEQFRAFDRRELNWIAALRLCRMLRHNAWVARRWGDPAFPRAYPDFGSSSYWGQQAMQLNEQMAADAHRH